MSKRFIWTLIDIFEFINRITFSTFDHIRMTHPQVCDHVRVSWWPVSRVTGHHGLTGQTWQRLRHWAEDGDLSPAQARPTRLRGQTQPTASGQGPPGSNVSLSHPMASAPASCSRKYGHIQASHWSDSTVPGLWLAGEDLARPPGPPLCHLGVARVSVTLTHVSRTPEAGCDVLWQSRDSQERDVTPSSFRHDCSDSGWWSLQIIPARGLRHHLQRPSGITGHTGQYKQHTFPADQTYYPPSTIPIPIRLTKLT